jgi:predicted amidohydrolase
MDYRTLFLTLFLAVTPVFSSGKEFSLDGWEPYAQRQALMPTMSKFAQKNALDIASSGHFRCNGSWRKSFPVTGGTYYAFRAKYSEQNVNLPRRSILARIDWKDREGNRLSLPDYPATMRVAGGLNLVQGRFRAPEGAITAAVDLIFRWDEDGRVRWDQVSFTPSTAPEARRIKLATINHRPRSSSGPEQNLETYGKLLEAAGEMGADIVCLPEGMTVIGTGMDYLEVAETIPGFTTKRLGELAKRHEMYIVAGIYEQEGETFYNSAVLIDRAGLVAGVYRKVSLPRGEIDSGFTPGSSFPVFETDFGKIGMMICWDSQFPEAARRLASAGAEIIFLPVWGGNETLFAARAIENHVHLVTSSFDAKTGIWDRKGELIAEAVKESTVAIAEVDLAEEIFLEWIGDLRAHISRESPPVQEE